MNKLFQLSLLGGLATLAAAPPAPAHHAFAAEFDANKPVALTGVVTDFKWTNPHSWLYLDVVDESGGVTRWAIEFGAPYSLLQKVLRKTDFPTGIQVEVQGFLARSGAAVANASSVTLPDGRDFFTAAGDSPHGRD